jgi:hypothetical protein
VSPSLEGRRKQESRRLYRRTPTFISERPDTLLYCTHCKQTFSERRGTIFFGSPLTDVGDFDEKWI